MDNKMRPLSMSSHSNFFSSLKQVEKRLKLEQTSQTESQLQESNFLSRGSSTLSSPMFLNLDQPQTCPTQYSSEPPQAFLSISQEFPLAHHDPSQTSPSHHLRIENEAQDDNDDDDIERLMQLLHLSEEQVEQRDGFDDHDGDGNSCHCEGGFYSKIVGVKGPKCRKEELRLDGWIKHFMNGDGVEKQEPLRLAHLLLGKAAFISEGADGGFGGLEFPSTIQEFLHTDPPSGLYSKIVGVKGPKCRKEVLKLDGWVKHSPNGDGWEKQEPLRLAHLLLGKAAFISEGADGGFGGLEFPSTIQEFLHTDPPSN